MSSSKGSPKSIVVVGLPPPLVNREILQKHFSKFGEISRLSCSLKHSYAVVLYTNSEAATKAKQGGSVIDPKYDPVNIYFSNKAPVGSVVVPRVNASRPVVTKVSPSATAFANKIVSRTKKSPVFQERKLSSSGGSHPKVERKLSSSGGFHLNIKNERKLSSSGFHPKIERKLSYSGGFQPKIARERKLSSSASTPKTVPSTDSVFSAQKKESPDVEKYPFTRSGQQRKLSSSDGLPQKPVPLANSIFSAPNTGSFKVEKFSGIFGGQQKNVSSVGLHPKSVPLTTSPFSIQRKVQSTVESKTNSSSDSSAYDLLNFNPDSAEAQELFSKRFTTPEEQYRALECRDKLLRARIPKGKVRVELATKLFGTCPDMCPEKERYMRQYQRQLTTFEIIASGNYIVDHRKAVKVYSRSSADQEEPLPHELRPGSTLEMTMNYLLHNIIPIAEKDEEILADWYNFLWDRTRSIRKDITQQQLTDLQSVSLMEKCTRFHIHCSSRLCELDLHSFDPKLNDENLMKCLQSLEHLYDDLERRGVKCPNEPEFRAYQIMMNLNEGDVLWDVQQRSEWVRNSPEVKFALKLHHSVFARNFVAFFRLVKVAPYMVSCILHRYFFQIRSAAIRSLWKAHATPQKTEIQMSFTAVQRMLGYGNSLSEFEELCDSYLIKRDKTNDRLLVNRKLQYSEGSRIVTREENLIDSKLITTVSEAINGEPLGPNPIHFFEPHSSFDENGYLIAGSVTGSSSGQDLSESQQSTLALVNKETTKNNAPYPLFASINNQKSVFPNSISSFLKKPSTTLQAFTGFSSSGSAGGGFSSFGMKDYLVPIPTAEEIKMQKSAEISRVCAQAVEKLLEKVVSNFVDQSAVITVRLAEERRRKEKERQQKNYWIEIEAENAMQTALNQLVPTIVLTLSGQEQTKHKVLQRICELYVEDAMLETIDFLLPFITQGAVREQKIQQEKLFHRVSRIFDRLSIRTQLCVWRRNVQGKILARKRQEEKVIRDRLDFPAGNACRKSKEDILNALRGNGKRSPNVDKLAKGTAEWLNSYERMTAVAEDYSQKVQQLARKQISPLNYDSKDPFQPRKRFNPDYCNHLWKRRCSDSSVTLDDKYATSRVIKTPSRRLVSISPNKSSLSKKDDDVLAIATEADPFLQELDRLMNETSLNF